MHAGGQLVGKQRIDGAVALKPAFAGKAFRHDADAKMCFTGTIKGFVVVGAGMMMSGMEMAFIENGKAFGRKGRGKFAFDCRLDGQGLLRLPYRGYRPRGRESCGWAMSPQMSILVSHREAPIIRRLLRVRIV